MFMSFCLVLITSEKVNEAVKLYELLREKGEPMSFINAGNQCSVKSRGAFGF